MFGWVFSLRVPYLQNPQYCVINKRRKHEIANFAVVKHLFIIFIVVKVVSYLENFGKLAPIKRRPAPACEGVKLGALGAMDTFLGISRRQGVFPISGGELGISTVNTFIYTMCKFILKHTYRQCSRILIVVLVSNEPSCIVQYTAWTLDSSGSTNVQLTSKGCT
jgi:hypothetical protein